MKKPSLKEVEKKTYMSYHQDGLIDIFIGVYILMFGAGILLSTWADFAMWFILPAIFPAIMGPIWISAKKSITIPRIGYVKFGIRGGNKLMAVFIGLMVAALGVFTVFGLGASTDQGWALALRNLIIPNGMIIVGILAAAISSLFAYTVGLTRLYVYGLCTLGLLLAAHFTIIPFAYALVAIGLGIVGNGVVLLTRFIHNHPLAQGDQAIANKAF